MNTRRDFLRGAGAFGCLATGGCVGFSVVGADGDWKAAFRRAGFDPDAPGASFFVVTSDVHVGQNGESSCERHLAEHVRYWNAMNPKPKLLAALGDFADLNLYFGHRPAPAEAASVADREYPKFKAIMSGLDRAIKKVYLVGNHDTYPGEDDRALWKKHFPDQPPYCAFEECGINFLKLDGGGDGAFSEEQERWIMDTSAKLPRDRQAVILVHQPSVGSIAAEREIGRVVKAAFGNRPGTSWLLGGHEHRNRFKRWYLSGGELAVATHCKDEDGWWAYGVKDGRIVARIFFSEKTGAFEEAPRSALTPSSGHIPTGLDGVEGVLWSAFVGSPEERECRVAVENTGDNGSWFYYVGRLHYRFPLAAKVAGATRLLLLGKQYGKRFKWNAAPVFLSADEKSWTQVKRIRCDGDINIYEIPPALQTARTLSMRYEAFGMDCDDCVAGFALLR